MNCSTCSLNADLYHASDTIYAVTVETQIDSSRRQPDGRTSGVEFYQQNEFVAFIKAAHSYCIFFYTRPLCFAPSFTIQDNYDSRLFIEYSGKAIDTISSYKLLLS